METKIKAELKSGHPLHTLISEHEIILDFVDELKKSEPPYLRNERRE